MNTYTIYNPTRDMIPVMINKGDGLYKQVNILPRSSIKITEDQLSDSIRNLTSDPRNILKIKRN